MSINFFSKLANKIMHASEQKNVSGTYRAIEEYFFDQQLNNHQAAPINQAFKHNVIVNRCVSLIASSAANVDWLLYRKTKTSKQVINYHPVLDLLHKPNPLYAGAEFFENLFAYKLLYGNAYILAVKNTAGEVVELHILRPDRVEVKAGKHALPAGYIYNMGGKQKFYPVDPITGKSNILHLKSFNPYDDWYGLSPLDAASSSINLHNMATHWNQSLLSNGARPSGAFTYNPGDGSSLSDEQFERLRLQIQKIYCSSGNAGRPLIMDGAMQWHEMSMTPRDMDFMESKNSAARDIALAFGVPPQLLAIKGDNTYSNMQEARLAFWEETVLPLLDHLIDSLNNWLLLDSNSLQLAYDVNTISALALRQEKNWQRINQATFLTEEEKKIALGIAG